MIVRSVFAAAAAVIAVVLGLCTFVIARFQVPDPLLRLSVVVSNYGLYLIPFGLVGIGLAMLARLRAGRVVRAFGALTVLVCVVGIVAAFVPVVASWREAQRHGATLSIGDYLSGGSNTGKPDPRLAVGYHTIEGEELLLDVKLPISESAALRPAVVWVHGGGWTEGGREDAPKWHRWLNDKGYAVFSIDYRLSPPPRWDQAPGDVKCAVGWLKQHAADYLVDPSRVMLAGGSAGGNLALLGAYSDERVPASCPVTDTSVAAVVAFYPPTDLIAAVRDPLLLSESHELVRDFTGGTLEEVPDRYAAASPVHYVRPGLPPTLLIHGTRDHVVPYAQSVELIDRLDAVGVRNELLAIPYGEHAYDIAWGDWGTQISRKVFGDFLNRYFPVN
ncbi:alpha/beta hydrolase [Nocardia uniformis]|uniref:Alpha/beta hydrolase n=1 Tax=Nocardia uniformis TaxID=53432 RepID=A0A849C5C3_9NOCA|nr:alpha/beta hydrolase [Nocardia uniformis]NNH71525.1 alpha/beta hydrolase [Nocardia uniformis]